MSKELWIEEVERLTDELVDGGMDPEDAHERACDTAHLTCMDRLYDHADMLRTREKEERS
jgi:hypothetical protein